MVLLEYEIFEVKTYREIKMNIKAYKEQPKTMMSTKEIAELTGKRHDHVVRDTKEMTMNCYIITMPHIWVMMIINYLQTIEAIHLRFYSTRNSLKR